MHECASISGSAADHDTLIISELEFDHELETAQNVTPGPALGRGMLTRLTNRICNGASGIGSAAHTQAKMTTTCAAFVARKYETNLRVHNVNVDTAAGSLQWIMISTRARMHM